jgi:hypothetical protein
MKQREIWYADLNPVQGSEQRGIRPLKARFFLLALDVNLRIIDPQNVAG